MDQIHNKKKRNNNPIGIKVGLLFAIILFIISGSALLAISFIKIKTLAYLKSQGIETTGIVDTLYTQNFSDGGPVTVYEIEFKHINEKNVRITNQFFTKDNRYKIGETIPLIYVQNNPEDAIIATKKETIVPVFFFIATTTFLFAIAGMLVSNFKKIERFLENNRSNFDLG